MAKPKFSKPTIRRVGVGPVAAGECSCLCQCGSKSGSGSGGGHAARHLVGIRDADRARKR